MPKNTIIVALFILCVISGISIIYSKNPPQFDNIEYISHHPPDYKGDAHLFDLVYTGEVEKEKLIEICKVFNNKYDNVVVKIFTSKDAFNCVNNNIVNDDFYSGYLLYYVKKDSNEIRWAQEKGAISYLFGDKTKF